MSMKHITSKQANAEPKVSIEFITVEKAQAMLDKIAPRQRKINLRYVQELATLMQEGKWHVTPQGLGINQQRELIDGQHRLAAIVKCGIGQTMLVMRNVSDEAMPDIDVGKKRSFKNVIDILGDNTLSISTRTKGVINMIRESQNRQNYQHVNLLLPFAEQWAEGIGFLNTNIPGTVRYITMAPICAPIVRAFYSQNTVRLEQWCKVLTEGITVSQKGEEDRAGIVLRERLLAREFNFGAVGRMDAYRLTERAMEHFFKRHHTKALKPVNEELFLLPEETEARQWS